MIGSTDSIRCNLDFEAQGKHFGSIDLSFSNNRYAFAKIPIPIVTIANGNGSTLLISAGTHGDEYEGQAIVRQLAHTLEPQDVNGRLILLPALNYPAMLDNARVSPLDQGNLNRCFPGVEGAEPTSAIADFVSSNLLPICDAGIDLHSGGSHSNYLPSVFLCTSEDTAIMKGNLKLAEAFDAPHTFVVRGADSPTGFDPVANQRGVPFISTELGGCATINPDAIAIGRDGVTRVLQHLGILGGKPLKSKDTCFLNGISGSASVSASFSGIFEPLNQPGDKVKSGDCAGWLYPLEEIARPAEEVVFPCSGTVMVCRNGARVERGSHLYLVASQMSRDDVLTAE